VKPEAVQLAQRDFLVYGVVFGEKKPNRRFFFVTAS
jgi:hypothetical protein